TQIAGSQIFFCCSGQCRRRRKGIVDDSIITYSLLPVLLTNILNAFPNTRYIILLGYQERNDHLPHILLQDTDAPSFLGSLPQIDVPAVNTPLYFSIIPV